jgi:hypothetical protein
MSASFNRKKIDDATFNTDFGTFMFSEHNA